MSPSSRPPTPLEFSPETPGVATPNAPLDFVANGSVHPDDVHHHSTVPLPADGSQLPLSARLRNATAQVHEEVQQPVVVLQLVGGRLAQPIHLRYLYMLHAIYSALERGLALHASHPALSGTHDPALLARATSLESDVQYYVDIQEPGKGWEESTVAKELRAETPVALDEYVGRLEELARDEDKVYLLLAHAYVRYLGDLSGGQFIARTLRKSYKLPPSGEGSAFYEFFLPDKVGSDGLPERAGPDDTKRIKEWFRDGMDAAGEALTEEQRVALIQEAKDAFKHNIGVFSSFEPVVAKWRAEHPEGSEAAAATSNGHPTPASVVAKTLTPANVVPETSAITYFGVALLAALGAYIYLRGPAVVAEA